VTSGFREKSIVQKTHRRERKCQATRFGVAAIIGMFGLTNISELSCGNYSGGSMKFMGAFENRRAVCYQPRAPKYGVLRNAVLRFVGAGFAHVSAWSRNPLLGLANQRLPRRP
jgi:hypothetical protein